MVKRFELPISPAYVNHWGLGEAGRELVANWLDSGKMIFKGLSNGYYVLRNGIDEPVPRSSMVLGCSTKDVNDDATIGQFGEGLKLAIVVILRDTNIAKIQIKNWDKLWTFSFGQSETWGTDTLIMEESDLGECREEFSVEFPAAEQYLVDIIESYTLESALKNEPEYIEKFSTDVGTIYMTRNVDGEIYVGGIHITNNGSTRYLIDLDPSQVELNRERSDLDEDTLYDRYKQIVQELMRTKDEKWTPYLQEILISGSFAEQLVADLEDEDYIIEWSKELQEKAKDKTICARDAEKDVADSLGDAAIQFSTVEMAVYKNSLEAGQKTENSFRAKIQPLGAHQEVLKFIETLTKEMQEVESTEELRASETLQKATKRLKALSAKWFSAL